MKVAYKEILIIVEILGYDKDAHFLMSSFDFLELQGFKLTRINFQEWDIEFESPQAELMFAIKYGEYL